MAGAVLQVRPRGKVRDAGIENIIVTPYLNSGFSRHGDRISIERKTGKQKSSGTHFDEAVQHAVARGLSYSIIIYDTEENVPEKTVILEGERSSGCSHQSPIWNVANGAGYV